MSLKNLLSLSLLTSVLMLGGCATTQNLSQTKLPENIKSQLTTNEAIIGYFGKSENPEYCGCVSYIDSSYYAKPVQDGYYRVLLGRNAEGHFLVQDFYQSNKKPQSSPVWVVDPLKLFSFEGSDVEGPVTLYREDGTVASKFVNKDGEALEGQDYYPNGQLGSSYKLAENGHANIELWYASGKKAAEYVLDEDSELVKSKAWKEDGTETDDIDDVSEKVYALLDHGFQED